ncbi:MAG: hypothetical protein D5R97_04190 [Candidatus Syntrophonatronum acetioxidans]|uniref:Cytochrome b561 bacterial/Ni-hydrogenase domain-containing protein n=1 Tax=Candidatus Syntrophonatronum acetioxidans TaxID=1795816 RepID=A0A424YFM0_9FIRM|nr:MAG: hypothetical protein D5R97_04190 [Candidatus Syntrophonatronum acetioxidans]
MKDKRRENLTIIIVFHWIFALTVFLLLASGYYLSFPRVEADWSMGKTRLIHLIAASIFISSLVFRVYYILIKGNWPNFLVGRKDLKTLVPLIKYYLFITEEPRCLLSRYDVGQKLFYLSWALGAGLQLISGLIMLNPGRFTFFVNLWGDLQTIRTFHFLVFIWFLITVPVHIYLSLTEDPLQVRILLTGKKKIPDK